MEKIKEHKKDLILFVIVFFISIVMCGAFLQPHYTHDTYAIINDGYKFYSYDKFLKEARPFSAIITLLADKINLQIERYMVISFILAITFLSISVVLVYKSLRKQFTGNSKLKDILVLIISFVIIFNYLAIEHILFLECSIFSLGILLSVIATRIIINNEKYAYIKASIIILISVFCYQGSISIFPMLVLTDKLLLKKDNWKNNFIGVIKIILIYGISMLLTILFAGIIMGGSRIKMDSSLIDMSNIIKWLKDLVVNSLGVIPPYINISIILFTVIAILMFDKSNLKEKSIYVLKYLFVMLAAVVICIAPVIVGSGLNLTPRMCFAYGTTIGISLISILFIIDNDSRKYQLIIFYILSITIFLTTIVFYFVITNQHILTNKLDEEKCNHIKQVVEAYEAKTGTEVNKISIATDSNKIYYPNMIKAGAITQNALNSWACRIAINYYIDRKLAFEPMTQEKYIEVFTNENTTEPIVIEGDTLYFNGGS